LGGKKLKTKKETKKHGKKEQQTKGKNEKNMKKIRGDIAKTETKRPQQNPTQGKNKIKKGKKEKREKRRQ
jgi:hypothetical protein